MANQYWSPNTLENHLPYNAQIIKDIYYGEVCKSNYSIRRIMLLEFSQYLENYLWPNYKSKDASHEHIMSIVVMVNEKFRERVDAWGVFHKNPIEFPDFFLKVLESCLKKCELTTSYLREQTALLLFLNHCFNSMEVSLCRDQAKRLVSLSMWSCLQPSKLNIKIWLKLKNLYKTYYLYFTERREQELKAIPQWKKFWKKLQKRDKPELKEKLEWERHFLQNLMIKFIEILESIPSEGELLEASVHYCERFLEFLIDLEALLPTRRFFNTVLDDCHLVVRCSLAPLMKREEGKLFSQVCTIF